MLHSEVLCTINWACDIHRAAAARANIKWEVERSGANHYLSTIALFVPGFKLHTSAVLWGGRFLPELCSQQFIFMVQFLLRNVLKVLLPYAEVAEEILLNHSTWVLYPTAQQKLNSRNFSKQNYSVQEIRSLLKARIVMENILQH